MRVLYVSNTFIWNTGYGEMGAPSRYIPLKRLVDAGHQAHFCFPSLKPDKWGTVYKGINMHSFRLPFGLDYHSIFKRPADNFLGKIRHIMLGNLEWIFYNAWGFFYGLKIGRRIKPQIIYAETEKAALIGYVLSRMLRARFIIRSYAGTGDYYSADRFIWRLKNARTVLAYRLPADRFIIVKDGTNTDLLAQRLGVPVERIAHWSNGVDFNMYNPDKSLKENVFKRLGFAPDSKIIISIARLHRIKRVDRLIFSLPELFSMDSKSVCVVAGDGYRREYLQRWCEDRSIQSRVIFTGLVSREEISDLLNAADIFVALADYSNCGNNLWEAMACAKCIVTLDNCRQIREVIDSGINGILVSPQQLNELPKILSDLISDDEKRLRLGENVRRTAMKILDSWDKRAQKEVELLESLVG